MKNVASLPLRLPSLNLRSPASPPLSARPRPSRRLVRFRPAAFTTSFTLFFLISPFISRQHALPSSAEQLRQILGASFMLHLLNFVFRNLFFFICASLCVCVCVCVRVHAVERRKQKKDSSAHREFFLFAFRSFFTSSKVIIASAFSHRE